MQGNQKEFTRKTGRASSPTGRGEDTGNLVVLCAKALSPSFRPGDAMIILCGESNTYGRGTSLLVASIVVTSGLQRNRMQQSVYRDKNRNNRRNDCSIFASDVTLCFQVLTGTMRGREGDGMNLVKVTRRGYDNRIARPQGNGFKSMASADTVTDSIVHRQCEGVTR